MKMSHQVWNYCLMEIYTSIHVYTAYQCSTGPCLHTVAYLGTSCRISPLFHLITPSWVEQWDWLRSLFHMGSYIHLIFWWDAQSSGMHCTYSIVMCIFLRGHLICSQNDDPPMGIKQLVLLRFVDWTLMVTQFFTPPCQIGSYLKLL